MINRALALTLTLLGTANAGFAQQSAEILTPASKNIARAPEQTIRLHATIDEAGRIQPIQSPANVVDIIDGSPSPRAGGECATPSRLDVNAARKLVFDVATEEGFFPAFVLSVAKIESRFDANALSPKGAIGLMQLEPATAARYKVDICDPADNVRGGVRFLRDLHARYRNPFYILAAYNAGERVMTDAKGVPPYPETVRFMADVINDFYEWPPAAAVAAGVPVSSRAAPHMGNKSAPPPREVARMQPRAPRTETPNLSWAAGFVMHVDPAKGE